MRIQEFLGLVLATAAVAPAQKYDPSPRGHLSTEGGGFAWYMGASSSSRHMFFDGELRGT